MTESAVLRRMTRVALAAALGWLTLAEPASAQLLGGLPGGLGIPGGLPSLPAPLLKAPSLTAADDVARQALGQIRIRRLQALVREHPAELEVDDRDAPVLRGQVLALSPRPESLAAAQAQGYAVLSRAGLAELGLDLVVLRAPVGVNAREAVRRLRRLDPAGRYDFNHIYTEVGAAAPGASPSLTPVGAGEVRLGLVDGGVDASHPALHAARIEQRAFAPGGLNPTRHGLAVASLLVGTDRRFRDAAPGARLFVADVYGTTAAGGSAEAVARALAWMAEKQAPVINVSLVGPPNLAVQAAVAVLIGRGHLIVAAVGNDGPAAPPLYPASYPGVIAVTAVDGAGRPLPEAGRAAHLDFAARGADMIAATPGGGFAAVRGTSFAAPVVARQLARRLSAPDRSAAARAVAAVAREAQDLGAHGPDRVYGRGLVGGDLASR